MSNLSMQGRGGRKEEGGREFSSYNIDTALLFLIAINKKLSICNKLKATRNKRVCHLLKQLNNISKTVEQHK